ncbi:MAG TPA: N-acetylmuramoyl-L-alanine amidase [Symbiobacteriaceae bacterium]|nr:N-acetylmuramoyl-L-alanine amidase [Symbiobacteriaceae bacterium]
MQRFALRQVALAGLALFLLALLARTAWTGQTAAAMQQRLNESGKYLRGAVIIVDPGHGGEDPGAVVGPVEEKHIVLDISKALKEMLEKQGARVILTRDEDKSLGGPIREELGRRVALIQEHKASVFVSIHANKDGCNCWGAQTFYQKKGMPAGKDLALAIQAQLRRLTPTTRVSLPADYFVLRTSPVPAAMVEVGFLTNAKEKARLQDPGYQRTVAMAVALGLADYFKSQVPEARADGSIGQ